jgi:hypothetical protein
MKNKKLSGNANGVNLLLAAALSYYFPYTPFVKSTYWKRKGIITYLSMTDQIELNFGDNFPRYDKMECLQLMLIPLKLFKDINSKELKERNFDLAYQIEINDVANKHKNYTSMSVGAFELCLKNYIDIFDLIPQNLAIAF